MQAKKSDLIVFEEGLLPGYFWLALPNGAEINSTMNKGIHAHYIRNSINLEPGEVKNLCHLAKENSIAIYLGVIERAHFRGEHSLYCSLVYIDEKVGIKSVHRKLQPS